MKVFVFLLFWVPGSCCLCKAQGKERRSFDGSSTHNNEAIPASYTSPNIEKIPATMTGSNQVEISTHGFSGASLFKDMPVMRLLQEQANKPVNYSVMSASRPQPVVKLGKICAAKVALTGFVLLAGNIPYFIKSLRSDDKTGLKLTSQRGRIAAGNKGYKRVTSLTFAIPLARKF